MEIFTKNKLIFLHTKRLIKLSDNQIFLFTVTTLLGQGQANACQMASGVESPHSVNVCAQIPQNYCILTAIMKGSFTSLRFTYTPLQKPPIAVF